MFQAFNDLMQQLKKRGQRVREHTEYLEHLVAERTIKLRTVNKQKQILIRAMNQRLEEERKYIARELHDELNSNLIVMRITSDYIKKLSGSLPEKNANQIIENTETLLDLIDRTYNSARSIIHRLRPEIIDSLGLIGALQELINNTNNALPDCSINLMVIGGLDCLDDEMNMVIYRIIQESLLNIMKYSYATNVDIHLSNPCDCDENQMCLEVCDDGVGFDTNETEYGIGIISIRERAVSLNGNATIVSSIDKGCRVAVHLPVN